MDNDQILKILKSYEKILKSRDNKPERGPVEDNYIRWGDNQLRNHALYMSQEIKSFLKLGRREKAMRWFGFLQCLMFQHCHYTIGQLCEENR
ncbi:MAG: hypothetical protein ACHQ1D_00645 [Nitrososphaerales archaeon]